MSSDCLKTSKSKIHKTRGYHRLPTNINKSKMTHVDLCRALLEYSHSFPSTENMSETITIEVHRSELRKMLNDDPHKAITQFCKNIRISDLKASRWYDLLATPKPRTKQGLCAGIQALTLPPPSPLSHPSPLPHRPPPSPLSHRPPVHPSTRLSPPSTEVRCGQQRRHSKPPGSSCTPYAFGPSRIEKEVHETMKSDRTSYDFIHPRQTSRIATTTSTSTIPTNIICHLQNHFFPITDLQCHMDVLQKKDWSQLTARLLDTTTSACSPSGDRLASNLVVVASTCIMTDVGKCIGELVANAIDASATNGAVPIGRFGMGFFACLGLLYKHPLRTIHVHSMRGPDSFLLSIRYSNENGIYEARIIPAASSCAPGTVVSIETGRDQFTVQETDQIRQSLKGFQFINRVRFEYGQSQDRFIRQHKWSPDVPPVYICVGPNGVRVEDWGTGIPLDVAISSLLIPSSSSKGLATVATTSDRPKVAVIKRKDDLSGLVLLVNNVVVFRYYDPEGHYLFKVTLPNTTKVTVARDDVILDPEVQENIADSFLAIPLQEWVIWDMETALRGYGRARPANNRLVHMILSRVYHKHGDRLVTNTQRLCLKSMFPRSVFYRAHQTNAWSVERRIRQLANDSDNLDTRAFIHNEPSLDDNGTLVLAYISSVTGDYTSREGMTSVMFVFSNDKSKLTKLLMNGRETGLDKDVVDRSQELRERFKRENINTILHTPLLKMIMQITYGRDRFYHCPREPEECCKHVYNLQQIYGPDRTLKILNTIMGQVVQITGRWGYTQLRPLVIDHRFIEPKTSRRIKQITSRNFLTDAQKNHDVLVYQAIMHDQRDRYDMEFLPVLLPAQYAYATGWYDRVDRELATFILDTVYGLESLSLRSQILYAHVLICTFADLERATRGTAYRGIGLETPTLQKDRVVLVKPNDRLRMLIEEHAYAFANVPDWMYIRFPVDIDEAYGSNFNYITQGIDNRTMRILTRAALLGLEALEWSVQVPLFPPLRDLAPHFTTNDLVSQVLLEPMTCAVTMFDNGSSPVSPQQHILQLVPIVTEYGNTRSFVDAVTIELLQNAIDAIRSVHLSESTIRVNIGIVENIIGRRGRSPKSEKFIEFVVSDPVGMDVETLMSLYVPFFSNKQSQDVGVTGEMGTGFFNAFRESARVVVHTSCSGERAYRVDSRPVRVNGRINDVAHHVSHPPRNGRGTDIALYIPIAEGSTNVHIQRLLFEYQRRIIEIACASTVVPIVVNGKRVMTGTSSTLGYVVTNGVPLATIRDLLPTLGFHPILASILSHSRHIELDKGEYKSRQSRETVTLQNPKVFTDDLYFRLYEYLLDYVVGNYFATKIWIDGRAFVIDIPDMNSNSDIDQVLPRIEPLGTLSSTGNHLFGRKYGTLRHFFINYVSSPKTPSITQLLHALHRKYKGSDVVFVNKRATITQFVQEYLTETGCTFTNDAIRSNMIRLLVEWFYGKNAPRGIRGRKIVSKTPDCVSIVDNNTNRLYVIFSSFIQTYARLGHAAGVKHMDEITTNRIKIELGKGTTRTKTCDTSYFSKQENKIFFAMGAYTDETIDTFCDRVMEWSRSNDETQTYRTMWEEALNCEIFRQYMLPEKRGSGATIPHEIEHVRRMVSSDVFGEGGIHGAQSEVLFTGDIVKQREYGCQVNQVYMHLIERCDFISEWKNTLRSLVETKNQS